eukprot:PhM_4_TR16796/c2_g1_i1/m.97691
MDVSFRTGINAIDKFTGQKDKQLADPFVVVSYCGKSSQTMTIAQSQHPEFFQVLDLPMMIPSMSRELRIRVYDYDALTTNDVIATAALDMHMLTRGGTAMPHLAPTWLTLYVFLHDMDVCLETHPERIENCGKAALRVAS